ncbi:MAG TPA: lipoprotein-releasing ABC transporter permease subunit [Steroidobacteraceae bacterium]|nr:lipoprotein-releasing ABC transporter permease subunit [Steroidobacteraceae bacterium]HRX90869.1 lipoprotein-releasing ABC transporter permease subunit [Steroidobacteraceae bacterium]
MPYEWRIGSRYLRSAHRRGFVSFVAFMSVIGLALGVAVLIVVLSVMNGFERELRARILSVTSHATLSGLETALPDWRGARAMALRTAGVTSAVPYIESRGLFARGSRVVGAQIRGVDPVEESRTEGIANRIEQGSLSELTDGGFRVVLGSQLASELGVKVGDDVIFIAPEGTATPTGIVPRMRRLRVVGLFTSGMYEFDRGLALVHLADAAKLYRMGTEVSGLRLTLVDPWRAPQLVRELALALGGGYFVSDWTRNHANFFRSIELTKSMLFLILLLIVAVAAFNIVATLVMIVKDKQADIAILRTLGAGPRNILAAFIVQGALIGLVGTALGAALGILVANNIESIVRFIEGLFGVQFLDPRVYLMSDLPAWVDPVDVAQICSVAFALCALATVYPAWRAARTQPAEALRHD